MDDARVGYSAISVFYFKAYHWWLDDMYLTNDIALPVNSNPGMVFPPRPPTETSSSNDCDDARSHSFVQDVASFINAILDYKELIDRYRNKSFYFVVLSDSLYLKDKMIDTFLKPHCRLFKGLRHFRKRRFQTVAFSHSFFFFVFTTDVGKPNFL